MSLICITQPARKSDRNSVVVTSCRRKRYVPLSSRPEDQGSAEAGQQGVKGCIVVHGRCYPALCGVPFALVTAVPQYCLWTQQIRGNGVTV